MIFVDVLDGEVGWVFVAVTPKSEWVTLVRREVRVADFGMTVACERHERHGARGKDRRGQRWSMAVLAGWRGVQLLYVKEEEWPAGCVFRTFKSQKAGLGLYE